MPAPHLRTFFNDNIIASTHGRPALKKEKDKIAIVRHDPFKTPPLLSPLQPTIFT
jgi:hypothetical protein